MKSRFDTVVPLPRALGRGGPRSTPRNLGSAAPLESDSQPAKTRPRRAWWRDLHSWQAGATARDDGRTPSSSSTCRSPDTARSSLTQSALGWNSGSPASAPSEHLKWAKQVHVLQSRWLKYHRQVCKPSQRKQVKHGRGERLPVLLDTMDASEWAANLRPDDEHIRDDIQKERAKFQERCALGLSKLHGTQQKWRECQKKKQRRHIQDSSEAGRETNASGNPTASVEEAREMEASSLSTWAAVDSETRQETVAEAACEGTDLSRSVSASSCTSSEPESQPEPVEPEPVAARNGDVHPHVADEIARGIRRVSIKEEPCETVQLPKSLPRRGSLLRRESFLRRGSRQLNDEPSAEITSARHSLEAQMPVGDKALENSDEMSVEERKKSINSLPGLSNPAESKEGSSSRKLISKAMSFGALDPMPSEESQEEEEKNAAAHLEAVQHVAMDEADATMVAHQKLRTWRALFPLEVLNGLADVYDCWPCVSGYHTTSVEILEEVMQHLFGWPLTCARDALKDQGCTHGPNTKPAVRKRTSSLLQLPETKGREARAREEAELQMSSEMRFKSLAEVLEVISKAVEFVELEHPEALWSDMDLQVVTQRFRQFATAKGELAVANLFPALRALCFPEMQLATLEDQRSLSDIVSNALTHKAKAQDFGSERRGRQNTNSEGMLSYQDFLRIASTFLNKSEQKSRLVEFEVEVKASAQFSFGLLEVEDIRGLFEVFIELKARSASEDSSSCFLILLQRCGIKATGDEVVKIKEVILQSTRDGEDGWSFSTFMGWLRSMHDQGIGNLQLVVQMSSSQDLQGRTGFVAVILREHYNGHT